MGRPFIAVIGAVILVSGCAAIGFNPPKEDPIPTRSIDWETPMAEDPTKVDIEARPPLPQDESRTIPAKPIPASPGEMICKNAPKELLLHLEEITLVGGAIRYTDGKMIHIGGNLWHVGVHTWVDPYSDGYRRQDVPLIKYFETNYPSVEPHERSSIAAYYPSKAEKCFNP